MIRNVLVTAVALLCAAAPCAAQSSTQVSSQVIYGISQSSPLGLDVSSPWSFGDPIIGNGSNAETQLIIEPARASLPQGANITSASIKIFFTGTLPAFNLYRIGTPLNGPTSDLNWNSAGNGGNNGVVEAETIGSILTGSNTQSSPAVIDNTSLAAYFNNRSSDALVMIPAGAHSFAAAQITKIEFGLSYTGTSVPGPGGTPPNKAAFGVSNGDGDQHWGDTAWASNTIWLNKPAPGDIKFAAGFKQYFTGPAHTLANIDDIDTTSFWYRAEGQTSWTKINYGTREILIPAGKNYVEFRYQNKPYVSGERMEQHALTISSDSSFLVNFTEEVKRYILTPGDATADGLCNSGDWVAAFQAGKYETGSAATWWEGDFDGDGFFTSADFVRIMVYGLYDRNTLALQADLQNF